MDRLAWLGLALTGARKTVTRGVNIEGADYHGKVRAGSRVQSTGRLL